MAEREIEFLREGLRPHVKTLAVDIGPRTPFEGDRLERAAAYIQSAFEEMGPSVTEQPYRYYGQRGSICLPRPMLLPNQLEDFLEGRFQKTFKSERNALITIS